MGLGASRASAPSGAFTVVQDPSEALYAHMPQAAIAADGIDFQVPPADVGPTILALVARRRETPSSRLRDPARPKKKERSVQMSRPGAGAAPA